MEYRKWKKIPVETSLLGFGSMRLKTVNDKIDEELALKLVDYAYNNGVNYFDMAMPYLDGQNESFMGRALKRYKRDTFYIATKLSLWMFETKEEIEQVIDRQLENLQTSYIDCYLLHALNKEKFEKIKRLGVMDIVRKWKKEGKIKYIGFSFHDEYDIYKEILNFYDWDFCQLQLNYMDQDTQQGIKGYYDALNKGIPVIVMEPVKGGDLAKFNDKVSSIFYDYNKQASLSSWAFRWVGSLVGVKLILSGMNTLEQLKDNLKTFDNFKPLNEEEQVLVSKVKEELKKIVEVGCTRCEYCLPCPYGVNIPRNFKIFNNYAMYKNENSALFNFKELKKEKADASICVACGECISKCPQKINIPEELSRMLTEMRFLK
ncbi:MAG: aldo/keto reductase [Bacilli bacterium]|jgi:predicted aldo/keto reductase-like oxidoreductase